MQRNTSEVAQKGKFLPGLLLLFLIAPFFAGAQNWTTVGSAVDLGNNHFQLTGTTFERGAIWAPDTLDLSLPFDRTFYVMQYHPSGFPMLAGDGMAFVLRGQGTLNQGAGGNGIGWANSVPASQPPITPSMGFEIDLWGNSGSGLNDISPHHSAIHRNGVLTSSIAGPTALMPGNARVDDSICRPFRITWNPTSTALRVFFNGNLIVSANYDMINNTFGGNPRVLYGLTGSTGNAPAVQLVTIRQDFILTPDTIICENATLPISATAGSSPPSVTWTNLGGGSTGLSCNNCLNPLFTPYGSPLVGYEFSVNDSLSCPVLDTLFLGIQSNPTANAGPPQQICQGDSVQIGTASGNPNLVHSWSPSAGLSNANIARPMASPAGNTVYTLTLTDTSTLNNCASTDMVMVTVNLLPNANAGVNDSVCLGDSVQIGAAAVANMNYNWQPAAGLSATNISDPWAMPATTTDYLLIQTNALTACRDSDSVRVVVKPLPVGNAGNDTAICGNSANLNGNVGPGAGTWNWIMGAGIVSNPSSPNSGVSGLVAGNNLFEWEMNLNGCILYDSVNYFSVSPVTAMAGPDSSICVDSLQLYANSPSSGTGNWTLGSQGTGIFALPGQANSFANGLSFGVNEFIWTVTDSVCSDADTVLITRVNTPTPIAGADQSICGSSTSVTGNLPGGASGNWSVGSGAGAFSNPNAANSQVNGLNFGGNALVWTLSQNGCSRTDTVIVTAFDSIPAQAGVDSSVCGTASGLQAVSPLTGSGQWSSLSGTIGNPSTASSTITGLPFGSTDVVWTVTNGPCISRDTVVVTAWQSVAANAGMDDTTCGTTYLLNGSNPSPGTGTWLLWAGSGVLSTPNASNSQVTGLSVGSPNQFVWLVTNGACTASDTLSLTALGLVNANAGPDLNICGSSTQLAATPPGSGSSGTWNLISGSGVFGSANSPNSSLTGIGTGQSVLTWTVSNGNCSESDTLYLNSDAPVFSAAGPDQTLSTDSTVMAATPPNPGNGSWAWIAGSGQISSLTDPYATVTQLGTGNNTLAWVVTNGVCPPDTDWVNLNYSPLTNALFIPEGISPDGNGLNEFLNIIGITQFPGNELRIFNRWGNLVREISNYDNNARRWAGENNSGEMLPDDTYFYVLELASGEKYQGFVAVKR